ncbi:MAG TPA: Hsp20/alpha crystallin family protein [Bacteroidia bacterium]|nr:Hsp20/alpha crystallin family protein [Bacteroidia bacterium]
MTLLKFKNDQPVKYTERMPYFNEMFNDFFDGLLTSDFRRTSTPAVNIIENDDNFTLEIAAPGLAKEDFKINVDNDLLSISAEKKNEANEKNSRFTRKEFSYVSFKRSFNLPEIVDAESIHAVYANGVMALTLPKKEEAKPKPVREIKIS